MTIKAMTFSDGIYMTDKVVLRKIHPVKER